MVVPERPPLLLRGETELLVSKELDDDFLPRMPSSLKIFPEAMLESPVRDKPGFEQSLAAVLAERLGSQESWMQLEASNGAANRRQSFPPAQVQVDGGDGISALRVEVPVAEILLHQQLGDDLVEKRIVLGGRDPLAAGDLRSQDPPRLGHQKAVMGMESKTPASLAYPLHFLFPKHSDLLGDLLPLASKAGSALRVVALQLGDPSVPGFQVSFQLSRPALINQNRLMLLQGLKILPSSLLACLPLLPA